MANDMLSPALTRMILDARTLPEVLRMRAADEPGMAFRFLLDGTSASTREWSYRDLEHATASAVAHLRDAGLSGQRVVLALEPGLHYLACLYALLRAGSVAVPSFPPTGSRARARLQGIVADCRPAAIMVDGRAGHRIDEVLQGLVSSSQARVVRVDEAYFESPEESHEAHDGDLSPGDLALLQYTSGSTGRPRGVMLTHDNLVSNCRTLIERMGVEQDRVGCTWLPPYHDMGLLGTLILSVYGGWPLVMLTPSHFVQQPVRWLKAISDHGVTVTVAPNFSLDLCVDSVPDEVIETLDLSSLRQLYCGAEPVLGSSIDRFRSRFAACGLAETAISPCYGLAEATLFVAGKTRHGPVRTERLDRQRLQAGIVAPAGSTDADPAELVSCGPPANGHEVVVVEPATCQPLPEGTIGEIWVSGPNVAQGYFEAGQASTDAFAARLITPVGREQTYLRTGDLGFLLDGELFVTGRLKELIVVAGRNLYPRDIELSAMRACPQLRAAVAFSAGGPGKQESLVVVGELRSRSAPPTETLRAVGRAVVTAVTHDQGVAPHDVHLGPVGVIATTTSGKVRRSATRQAYLDRTLKAFRPTPEVSR